MRLHAWNAFVYDLKTTLSLTIWPTKFSSSLAHNATIRRPAGFLCRDEDIFNSVSSLPAVILACDLSLHLSSLVLNHEHGERFNVVWINTETGPRSCTFYLFFLLFINAVSVLKLYCICVFIIFTGERNSTKIRVLSKFL